MIDDLALRPLEPAYLSVLRTRAAINAGVLLALALGAEIAVRSQGGPPGLVAAPALLLAAWSVFLAPQRRWARWAYAFTETELHVARGWWTHAHTIVPVRRVQHIDLTRAPLERKHGLATLVLHTAGTEHSRVVLPGLLREEAERIRDDIRASIEREAR
ncbi:PH domain-containing protein [Sphingomonas lenta]|uniref:YdbS-like PH domain-containing protein n=1 Tax=Sphingomonas lenta TaxID=1141887 RepID=A0A2A2SEW9_9SPHN|nr:PH domain-containing protein [Sphingomonas lenta]PAX07753.1 hypothetical protein CKY28_08955 [Sphingomonas lenta]